LGIGDWGLGIGVLGLVGGWEGTHTKTQKNKTKHTKKNYII